MKKIGIITTSKVLAQSLDAAMGARPELELAFYALLNPGQAALDAEVLEIDVALIDVTDGAERGMEDVCTICETLRRAAPKCRLILLVSQKDLASRSMAVAAVKRRQADDFVFYDASLDYLFAKLAAL